MCGAVNLICMAFYLRWRIMRSLVAVPHRIWAWTFLVAECIMAIGMIVGHSSRSFPVHREKVSGTRYNIVPSGFCARSWPFDYSSGPFKSRLSARRMKCKGSGDDPSPTCRHAFLRRAPIAAGATIERRMAMLRGASLRSGMDVSSFFPRRYIWTTLWRQTRGLGGSRSRCCYPRVERKLEHS